jgi:uncharacterized membrane protein YjjP (DUF1212 family)
MKLVILLFTSLILGFILSVFLTKVYNINIPPFITGGLITAIGYFIFKNSLKEDEN